MHIEVAELHVQQTLERVCRRHGCEVSVTWTDSGARVVYVLNYRQAQWRKHGGLCVAGGAALLGGLLGVRLLRLLVPTAIPGEDWVLGVAAILALIGMLCIGCAPRPTTWAVIKREVEQELVQTIALQTDKVTGQWLFLIDTKTRHVLQGNEIHP